MKIYRSLDEIPFNEMTCLTIGGFDGIHLGHKAIIKKLIEDAGRINGRSLLITFDPHPINIIHPGKKLAFLTSPDEKISILKKNNLDAILILKFNKELAKTSAKLFIQTILKQKIGMTQMVIGHDHTFGHHRDGDLTGLKQLTNLYDFVLDILEPVYLNETLVSSTQIREYIKMGHMEQANACLGRGYTITGKVIEGEKIGQTLGFPTANISMEISNKIIPKDGIYAGIVFYDDIEYEAMLYIGTAPTIPDRNHRIEAHLFNFSGSIYGKKIQIGFNSFIRDDKKFKDLNHLKSQITNDQETIKKVLSKQPWRFTWV